MLWTYELCFLASIWVWAQGRINWFIAFGYVCDPPIFIIVDNNYNG